MIGLRIPDAMELHQLIRQGTKVICPFCGKKAMSEMYLPFSHSGIGQHIQACHPELVSEVKAAGKKHEKDAKKVLEEREREKKNRPLREHVITGAHIDEIIDELRNLVEMMEPYYSQGNAADNAYDLITKLDALASS